MLPRESMTNGAAPISSTFETRIVTASSGANTYTAIGAGGAGCACKLNTNIALLNTKVLNTKVLNIQVMNTKRLIIVDLHGHARPFPEAADTPLRISRMSLSI